VVFIVVQNLAGIDAVVSIIRKYSYFASLLEDAYSRPLFGFLGIYP